MIGYFFYGLQKDTIKTIYEYKTTINNREILCIQIA